jgi:hypothetical protein
MRLFGLSLEFGGQLGLPSFEVPFKHALSDYLLQLSRVRIPFNLHQAFLSP